MPIPRAAYRSTSAVLDLPYFLTLFAEAHLTHGNPERALAVLDEVDQLGVARRGINTEHEQRVLKEAVLRELDRPEDAAAAAEIARAAAARRRLQAANAVANA